MSQTTSDLRDNDHDSNIDNNHDSNIDRNHDSNIDNNNVANIIDCFQKLVVYYQLSSNDLTASDRQKLRFKIHSFQKAIKSLQGYTEIISNTQDIESLKVAGIGKGIKTRMIEILEHGTLQELSENGFDIDHHNPVVKVETGDSKEAPVGKDGKGTEMTELKKLMEITGVGPASAKKLFKREITLDRLLDFVDNCYKTNPDWDWKQETDEMWNILTHHQKIGVVYYRDIDKRIPRAEIQRFEKLLYPIITRIDTDICWEICGSFRRGQGDSGDMDVLLSHPTQTEELLPQIVKALENCHILVDHLTMDGKSKYMGIGRIPIQGQPDWMDTSICRRIDIRVVPYKSYISSLLYFTGSARENIRLRKQAISKGFKLSEYGLYDEHGEMFTLHDEKEAYDILGLSYRLPTER